MFVVSAGRRSTAVSARPVERTSVGRVRVTRDVTEDTVSVTAPRSAAMITTQLAKSTLAYITETCGFVV